MKTLILLAGALLFAAGSAARADDAAIDEMNMGLSKTTVFDTPTPVSFEYAGAEPKKSQVLPRAWEGAPPQISHRIDEFLPITADDNQCLECHEIPKYIGKAKKGKSPMPRDHYVDLRSSSDEMSDEVAGARFVCTQCHVPQSDAPALVENTFGAGK
jgi:cytochrome c-type protein NapB